MMFNMNQTDIDEQKTPERATTKPDDDAPVEEEMILAEGYQQSNYSQDR